MRPRLRPWALAALLLGAGCGNRKVVAPDGGAATDATGTVLRACLDSPTSLPRPPSGTLPCDLIPPELVL